jgi:hypothetical protein
MPLYTFIHNLLNVLVQIANKIGLQKKNKINNGKGMKIFLLDLRAVIRKE